MFLLCIAVANCVYGDRFPEEAKLPRLFANLISILFGDDLTKYPQTTIP